MTSYTSDIPEMFQILKIPELVIDNEKQIAVVESMLEDIIKLGFNSLYHDVIKRWLEEELNGAKQQSAPTVGQLPTEVTTSSATDDRDNETPEEDSTEYVEAEDEDVNGSVEGEEEETTESNVINESHQKDLGIKMVTPSVLLFVLLMLICVMR